VITDDDIMETAVQLAKSLDLDEDGRNEIAFRIQRLVWPPSPHYFLHDRPHVEVEMGPTAGELRCPGCGRKWRVNQGPNEDAVYQALTAAHEEYRSGQLRSVPVRTFESRVTGQRLPTFAGLFGSYADIEVHDERWPG